VGDCCDPTGYQSLFSERFARRVARSYRRRGLDATRRRLVSFLADRGIRDASVLEIGGGVGELQVELLSRGARQATIWRSRMVMRKRRQPCWTALAWRIG
jgi:16S rRNA A1518/A1519 N6-dimethyltransferase RsmA/KsgA/DIM1 with predicted DNA glycosylase/AP lyase activity